jgi:hypothetical protein
VNGAVGISESDGRSRTDIEAACDNLVDYVPIDVKSRILFLFRDQQTMVSGVRLEADSHHLSRAPDGRGFSIPRKDAQAWRVDIWPVINFHDITADTFVRLATNLSTLQVDLRKLKSHRGPFRPADGLDTIQVVAVSVVFTGAAASTGRAVYFVVSVCLVVVQGADPGRAAVGQKGVRARQGDWGTGAGNCAYIVGDPLQISRSTAPWLCNERRQEAA